MQEAGQILSQQQKAVMTPQLIQSLNLMALPLADLREKILEEAENNPALEILSAPAVVRESALPEKFSPDSGSAPALSAVRSGGGDAADANRSFLEKVLSRQETLQEHLDTGLSEISLPPETGNLARLIIHNLDANGFHRCDPALLPGGGNPETRVFLIYSPLNNTPHKILTDFLRGPRDIPHIKSLRIFCGDPGINPHKTYVSDSLHARRKRKAAALTRKRVGDLRNFRYISHAFV